MANAARVISARLSRNNKTLLDGSTLASVRREMARPRMTTSVRKFLESAPTDRPFEPNEYVYNRDTKENGLIRQVYEMDGVTVYNVWIPSTPDLLRGGYLVSDWAESVLELSDGVSPKAAFRISGR